MARNSVGSMWFLSTCTNLTTTPSAPLKLTLGMHTGWAHPAHQGGLPFAVPSQWRGRSWCPGSSPAWDQRYPSASYTPGTWLQQGIGRKKKQLGHIIAITPNSILHTRTKTPSTHASKQWDCNIPQRMSTGNRFNHVPRYMQYLLFVEHKPSLQNIRILCVYVVNYKNVMRTKQNQEMPVAHSHTWNHATKGTLLHK